MNPFLFIKRIRHCAGFGVQSPNDYCFVRNVIYERLPYYGYAELSQEQSSRARWIARLLLRIANHAQASQIVYWGDVIPDIYAKAINIGCGKTNVTVVDEDGAIERFASNNGTWFVMPAIYKENKDVWEKLKAMDHIIAYDLYHIGIAYVDMKRWSETHIINPY